MQKQALFKTNGTEVKLQGAIKNKLVKGWDYTPPLFL